MKTRKIINPVLIFSSLFLLGCSQKNEPDIEGIQKIYEIEAGVLPDALNQVASKNYLFGHQSVGKNILGGLNYWIEKYDANLNIIESSVIQKSASPAFHHYRIGENRKPLKKIDDFHSNALKTDPDSVDAIFFKFCYVDINSKTNVDSLFSYYKKHISDIRARNPQLEVILFTAPLKNIPGMLTRLVRKIRGNKENSFEDNVKRHAFNERIRNELGSEYHIFDLARVESTLENGNPNLYRKKGKEIPHMNEYYTYDGGHLNDLGARIMAYNLISFLAGINR